MIIKAIILSFNIGLATIPSTPSSEVSDPCGKENIAWLVEINATKEVMDAVCGKYKYSPVVSITNDKAKKVMK